MNKVRDSIFPDSLMIRDVGIYDDLGGAGQRIYTTAGQGYEKQKYIRADKVQEMLEQQREACANGIKLIDEANGSGIQGVIFKDEAIDACLSAVDKEDDK